ncbi:MAG: class I SAM-dependent methyltransferase [Chloroflexota bacterium]
MRDLACAICDSDARRVVYESTIDLTGVQAGQIDPYSAHYRIVQCQRCGLVYASPIFDEAEVETLYTGSPHTNVADGEDVNIRRTMELYYQAARPWLPGRQRILDIGCDTGSLLDIARQDGFRKLYGIEPRPVSAAIARKVPGATISDAFYERQEYPPEHFDLVSLVHVVDHLVHPTHLLDKAWQHLRPGGVILAVVHNSQSVLARVLGERFPPYNLYHHYYFSPRTLRLLFQRSGFEVLEVRSTLNCYSVGTFAEKLPLLPPGARRALRGMLDAAGIGRRALTVPLGNIGIVARRPLT